MALLEEYYLKDIALKSDILKTPAGDLQTLTGTNNLHQALFRRLVTVPGTLVHRPNYGVGLKRFINAPNTIDNQRQIANLIKSQFERDFRVEEVTGVSFTLPDTQPDKLTISVRVKPSGFQDEVFLEFQPFNSIIVEERL